MKRLLLLFIAILFSSQRLAQAEWCGKSDEASWKELSSLYWASASGGSNRPIIYTIAAPWCPFCAETFRRLRARPYAFDVRFIPSHDAGEKDTTQIADLVLDGTATSLVRVYVQRVASNTGISPRQKTFIEGVQDASDVALHSRFGQQVKTWGSPTSLIFVNGKIQLVVGEPNLEAIDRLLSAGRNQDVPSTTRRFLATGLPETNPIEGKPAAIRNNVIAHVLPDGSSLSAVCFNAGNGLDASGVVVVEGKTWLVFDVPYKPNRPLHYYGRGEDFSGWKNR